MAAGVIAQRQLQHMLEIVCAHLLGVAMCQPVGVERHHGARTDDKQAEPHPGTYEKAEV